MNRKRKKLMKLCAFLFMLFCGTFIFANGNVKDVQAASRMVMLYGNKTYTQYDFTGDGRKNRFKCTADNERGYVRLYLNGSYKQRIFVAKGANLYWCGIDRKNVYLLAVCYQYGGHELKVYKYSSGRFKAVPGKDQLNKVFMFSNFSKIQGDTLYVYSSQGSRNGGSFRNASGMIEAETKFKLRNNKISCISWNSRIIGRRTFYAQNSFQTSASDRNLNIKNGPKVKAGQKVTLNYVKLGGNTYVYQISVGGRKGWFKDSYSIQFR